MDWTYQRICWCLFTLFRPCDITGLWKSTQFLLEFALRILSLVHLLWVLLSRLARYLWTADSQFGFRQGHGTEMAIFALKQTVDFYRNQDTPVYMCFLDTKKTFDRVNHWTLAKKLLERNVPLHIVKLFIFWYREQEFMVWWGTHYQWNSVAQMGSGKGGSCHAPLLYNVRTDDLNHCRLINSLSIILQKDLIKSSTVNICIWLSY